MCRPSQDQDDHSAHGRLDWLCFINAKLFEYVTSILYLANEGSIFGLLDLKSKKECKNHHHGHLKPINHYFTIFLVKRVESALPIVKSFSIRKSLRYLYHALGACLSP
jgi:hypothetical protein